MVIQMKRLVVLLAMLTVVVSGCGPKAAPSTSVMDTPEYHYTQGLKYLDRDQLDDAMREFDRSIDLAPKVRSAISARGWFSAKKGISKRLSRTWEQPKGREQGHRSPYRHDPSIVHAACRRLDK